MNTLREHLWEQYIEYLREWADNHESAFWYSASPSSYDEWLDCEREACSDDEIDF